MAVKFNWWNDRWECDTYEEAFKKSKETNDFIIYKENNRWREFLKN